MGPPWPAERAPGGSGGASVALNGPGGSNRRYRADMSIGSVFRAGLAVLLRPWLVPTALRQVWRLRRDGWWRRAPFVPIPDPAYLRFRMVTAYGDPDHPPDAGDVVTYLEWCRAWPHLAS